MIDIRSLGYQLKSTSCEFVSFKNNRFYFKGWYEQYKISGYIYHTTLLENVENKKEVSEVYRHGIYRLKDFDGYKITDMETSEIYEQVRWEE